MAKNNSTDVKLLNEQIRQLQAENEKLKRGGVPVKLPWSVRLKVKTEFGRFKTVHLKIKDGFPYMPVSTFDDKFKDARDVISTVALMKYVTEEELTDEEKERYPFLLEWDIEKIKNELARLYIIRSGYIEELK